MDFRFTPEQERFRQEVRAFAEAELTPEFRRQLRATGDEGWLGYSAQFSKKLAQRGWIGLAWPQEFGGKELGPLDRTIFVEELAARDAPMGYHIFGERQVGLSLMRHGSEEQKRTYLPAIIRGDICFCVGMSEREAGSDLAGVQTRAVADGDDYIVDGHKIWTTHAHRADMCWLVVRTNFEVAKHKGISILLVAMQSPGITAQPMLDVGGGTHFNEVFFDGVRVPRRNLVGEENQGWYILTENLDFERAGIERIVGGELIFRLAVALLRQGPRRGTPQEEALRRRLAELAVELEVGRLLAYQVAWLQSQGQTPTAAIAISKVCGSEWVQRTALTSLHLAELYGAATPPDLREKAVVSYLAAAGDTIRAGTSEILRNVIAQRGLDLPRG